MTKLTNQQVFDIVLDHSRRQPYRCADGEQCLYRDGNGNKCFAGALISDDEHDLDMEGMACWEIPVLHKRVEDLNFLSGLQGIHDNKEAENWEEDLHTYAIHFGLVYRSPQLD